MLVLLNHLSENLVLLVSRLNCVEHYLAIHHLEVGPERSGETVVPVLEFSVRSPWCHLTTLGLELVHRVVASPFWSESAIELILEAAHEGAISRRLHLVILHAIIADYSCATIVVGVAAFVSAGGAVTFSVEIHFFISWC